MPIPVLSPLEARVLGVLVEKQRAVPDIYPLSLNALTAGCNQKSSRDPVMDVTEAQVQGAVDALRTASLVVESSGGRVMRHAHNLERALDLPGPAAALLAVLMLRGPQTVGELRINSERLHRFADIFAVEGYLRELAERPAGALVVELARAAGTRETRWAHLLAGPPTGVAAADAGSTAPERVAEPLDLVRRIEALEQELERLRGEMAALRAVFEDSARG